MAVPEEAGFALDPYVASIFPYHQAAAPDTFIAVEVRVHNHAARDAVARVELVLPPDWTAQQEVAEGDVEARGEDRFAFRVFVPPEARGRAVLCADVTLGERRLGQLAEALVDVRTG